MKYIVLIVFLIFPFYLFSQNFEVNIRVFEKGSKKPMENAKVNIVGLSSTETLNNGEISPFNIEKEKEYTIEIRLKGYELLTETEYINRDVTFDYYLTPIQKRICKVYGRVVDASSENIGLTGAKVTLSIEGKSDSIVFANNLGFFSFDLDLEKLEKIQNSNEFYLNIEKKGYQKIKPIKGVISSRGEEFAAIPLPIISKETIIPSNPPTPKTYDTRTNRRLLWLGYVITAIPSGIGYYGKFTEGLDLYDDYKNLTVPKDFFQKYPEFNNRQEGLDEANRLRKKGRNLYTTGLVLTVGYGVFHFFRHKKLKKKHGKSKSSVFKLSPNEFQFTLNF